MTMSRCRGYMHFLSISASSNYVRTHKRQPDDATRRNIHRKASQWHQCRIPVRSPTHEPLFFEVHKPTGIVQWRFLAVLTITSRFLRSWASPPMPITITPSIYIPKCRTMCIRVNTNGHVNGKDGGLACGCGGMFHGLLSFFWALVHLRFY